MGVIENTLIDLLNKTRKELKLNLVEYNKLRNQMLDNIKKDDEEYVKSLCWVPITPLKLRIDGLDSFGSETYRLHFVETTVERYLASIKGENMMASCFVPLTASADRQISIRSYNKQTPYLEFSQLEDLMKFMDVYQPNIYADAMFERVYSVLQRIYKGIKNTTIYNNNPKE